MPELLKSVAKYPNAEEARRAGDRLEHSGIAWHLDAQEPAAHAWQELGLPPGFCVLVETSRAREAVEILARLDRPTAEPPVPAEPEADEPWTCAGCHTQVPADEPVCPQCDGSREESERLQRAAAQAGLPGHRALPWYTGFLLLFPPALVVYLIWKAIAQAGRSPQQEDEEGEEMSSPEEET